MTVRRRLDAEVVRPGLLPTRQQAADAIAAGRVTVGGAPANKASRLVAPDEPVVVAGPPARFVSRGGAKLDAALDRFSVDPAGRRCLDAGASTGGFTDCLLQRGAALVYAVDVGHGLLHERVASDPRVVVRDRTNARHLGLADVDGVAVEVVTADLSFIGLSVVTPALVAVAGPGADLVLLVKPQFEAGRADVARGRGVVRDPDVWARVLVEVKASLATAGATMMEAMVSPLTVADGNVEFLVHCTTASGAGTVADEALKALAREPVPGGGEA
jgi:23S rRNA (cytidine1920-2'-O)/16S rRNA (cytidine1409-2'-O)-methyltransferase